MEDRWGLGLIIGGLDGITTLGKNINEQKHSKSVFVLSTSKSKRRKFL